MSDGDYDDEYEEGDVNTYDDDDINEIDVPTALAVLEYVAKAIVDDPDSLDVELDERRDTVRLNVHAAPDDMGRLIGRRGRVAGAIRVVVRAAAARDDARVEVEFVE